MYMLDTNTIIMAVRHPDWSIYSRVRSRLGRDLCISSVTYGELEYGIRKSAAPEKNRIAITELLMGIRILGFDAKGGGALRRHLRRPGKQAATHRRPGHDDRGPCAVAGPYRGDEQHPGVFQSVRPALRRLEMTAHKAKRGRSHHSGVIRSNNAVAFHTITKFPRLRRRMPSPR